MFESLRVFEVREPIAEVYVSPALDTVGTGVIVLPPEAPVILTITSSGLTWENMPGVTGWAVENLVSGNIWSQLTTLPALTPVQIIWTGFEWQIQQQVSGVWQVLYRGPQPLVPGTVVGSTAIYQTVLTPNLIPRWYQPDGVTLVPGITVSLGGVLDANGVTVTGAPNSVANVSYAMPGPQNGRNSYFGPEIYTYSFSPTIGTLYRIRAFNSAGEGPYSNVVSLNSPPLDWTQLSWGQNGFPDVYQSGVGVVSFTPLNSMSNQFENDCSSVDDVANSAYSENQATISYTGPAKNCNLHLVVSGSPDATAFRWGTIFVSDNSGNLLGLNLVGLANGTYDYPFTIPDTGGNPDIITVDVTQIYTNSNANLTGTESAFASNLTGTFSNV